MNEEVRTIKNLEEKLEAIKVFGINHWKDFKDVIGRENEFMETTGKRVIDYHSCGNFPYSFRYWLTSYRKQCYINEELTVDEIVAINDERAGKLFLYKRDDELLRKAICITTLQKFCEWNVKGLIDYLKKKEVK